MKFKACISFLLLLIIPLIGQANPLDTLTVKVLGTAEDARFEPVVLQIQPGDVIRFEVVEGLHTVTAYHPDNRRPLRIPKKAQSFDSGMLTEGQIWFLHLDEHGVYDYFCQPHERMGHAGRILVGEVKEIPNYPEGRIPEAVLNTINTHTKLIEQ